MMQVPTSRRRCRPVPIGAGADRGDAGQEPPALLDRWRVAAAVAAIRRGEAGDAGRPSPPGRGGAAVHGSAAGPVRARTANGPQKHRHQKHRTRNTAQIPGVAGSTSARVAARRSTPRARRPRGRPHHPHPPRRAQPPPMPYRAAAPLRLQRVARSGALAGAVSAADLGGVILGVFILRAGVTGIGHSRCGVCRPVACRAGRASWRMDRHFRSSYRGRTRSVGEPRQQTGRRRGVPFGLATHSVRHDDHRTRHPQEPAAMTTPRLCPQRYELGECWVSAACRVHHGWTRGSTVTWRSRCARRPARDPQFQIRFRREAQNAARSTLRDRVRVRHGEVQTNPGRCPTS